MDRPRFKDNDQVVTRGIYPRHRRLVNATIIKDSGHTLVTVRINNINVLRYAWECVPGHYINGRFHHA